MPVSVAELPGALAPPPVLVVALVELPWLPRRAELDLLSAVGWLEASLAALRVPDIVVSWDVVGSRGLSFRSYGCMGVIMV